MPRLRSRSIEWLLALLVLRQDRAVDRSWLAGTLWPGSDESKRCTTCAMHWCFRQGALPGVPIDGRSSVRTAVEANPYRGESYRAQMRLYAGQGGVAAALETYRKLEQVLRAELGLSPSAALRDAMGLAQEPYDVEERDREAAVLRAALGEEVFTAARAEGRAMSLDEAVSYALGGNTTCRDAG
jgi:DNA-binding SARP family transcriptional activator